MLQNLLGNSFAVNVSQVKVQRHGISKAVAIHLPFMLLPVVMYRVGPKSGVRTVEVIDTGKIHHFGAKLFETMQDQIALIVSASPSGSKKENARD